MIEKLYSWSGHHILWDCIDLAVHHKLLGLCQLHEDDPEVGSSQIKGEKLTVLASVREFPDIGWEAFYARIIMGCFLMRTHAVNSYP